ncbi:MAG: ATP-binding protein, partial [Pyrobaculum sp.]
MECLYRDALDTYSIIIFVGQPGVGKTTLALRLVAYALWKNGKCGDKQTDCLEAAARRLFLGENFKELIEYLISLIDSGMGDYVIVDDAALGYWDIAHPKAWSLLMDALKIARNSIATRALIFTTTSTRFLSKRVLSMARVYYVKRAQMRNKFDPVSGCIDFEEMEKPRLAIVVKHVTYALAAPNSPNYTPASIGVYAKTVAAVPVDKSYAMPKEIETAHMEARRRRARASLEEILKILEAKKN